MKYLYLIITLVTFLGCKKGNTESIELEKVATEELTEEKTASKNLQLLQGSWQNTLDPLSVVKVKGTIISNYYSNISAGPGMKITLSDRCIDKPDPSRLSEQDRYISISGTYSDCYYITTLDEENLVLNFLNAGIDLTFKRL